VKRIMGALVRGACEDRNANRRLQKKERHCFGIVLYNEKGILELPYPSIVIRCRLSLLSYKCGLGH
jgi:hypothetical protein